MAIKDVCDKTHSFLLAGICPWCNCEVVKGHDVPDNRGGVWQVRRWNIPALMEALDQADKTVRTMVVSNLALHGPNAEEALPVLRKALCDPDTKIRSFAVYALIKRGGELSIEEADKFEQEVQSTPNDTALHILLVDHYLNRADLSEAACKARQRHFLWIIENAPEVAIPGGPDNSLDDLSPKREGYHRAKELWLMQVEANDTNPLILGNAARFFTPYDIDLSEVLIKKAQALEPNNSEWLERLAHLYELRMNRSKTVSRRDAAAQSLAHFESAFNACSDGLRRFFMLPDLAKTAFEAGEMNKAKAYATALLETVNQTSSLKKRNGDAVHHGNLVLGRIALRTDDVQKAKAYLIEAGKSAGSPALNAAGPNMMLAKELLELGEREVVIQYLELCSTFWESPDHRAEQWIYVIKQGGIPNFGANMDY